MSVILDRGWSHTLYMQYLECPFRVKLKYIECIPEPPRDDNSAAARGIRVHDGIEDFFNRGKRLPEELSEFKEIYTDWKELGAVGERAIYFDDKWKVIADSTIFPFEKPESYWLVVKIDIDLIHDNKSFIADAKTGRKDGNEFKHSMQGKIYRVAEWCANPDLDEYHVEFHYLDKKDIWTLPVLTPDQVEFQWARLDSDIAKLYNERLWRPRPNKMNCRYCPYNSKGTASCPVSAV